jgi:hypothetical protein
MREFVDEQGRTWGVHVDVEAIRRVRKLVGYDLAKCMDSRQSLEQLVDDVVTLVDVLHALCIEQCNHLGVTAEDFAKALYGDAISRATTALMESIIDFFPQSRGKILRQLWEKSREVAEIQMGQLQAAVDALTLSDSSAFTPGMQELTQHTTHSEALPKSRRPTGKRQHD